MMVDLDVLVDSQQFIAMFPLYHPDTTIVTTYSAPARMSTSTIKGVLLPPHPRQLSVVIIAARVRSSTGGHAFTAVCVYRGDIP